MDKPKIQTVQTLNLIDVARWISTQEGYPETPHHKAWTHRLMSELEIPGNDCYVSYYLMDDDDIEDFATSEYEALYQFDMALRKYYNLNSNDHIVLKISW